MRPLAESANIRRKDLAAIQNEALGTKLSASKFVDILNAKEVVPLTMNLKNHDFVTPANTIGK